MSRNNIIHVQGHTINITQIKDSSYISLTDICRGFGDDIHIYNWMRNRNTVEFLGIWETLNNPNFKGIEFDTFRKEAGLNNFSLTPRKWIDATDAIGIISKAGKGGGTYAHKDIATEFCSWLSPTFKIYLIKEFDRLKEIEGSQHNLEWNIKRILSKTNYHLHTNAVKEHRIPQEQLPKEKEGLIYADEAEILNFAVFGYSSKTWREENQGLALKGMTLRDFASINELAVLSNMESINSVMLASKMQRNDRIRELRNLAQQQLKALDRVDFEKSYKRTIDGSFQKQLEQPKENSSRIDSFEETLKKLNGGKDPNKK